MKTNTKLEGDGPIENENCSEREEKGEKGSSVERLYSTSAAAA